MNEEQELRARLEAVDVPPSRLEVEALVRAGRRRVFRHRSFQGAGGVALATAVLLAAPSILTGAGGAQPAAGPADPSAATGPAAGPATRPAPTGPATPGGAGRAPTAPGTGCPVTELPVPPGMTDVAVSAVDPTGRYVVGNSTVGQNFRPLLWTDGQPKALPVTAASVQATAVNPAGVVVGLVQDGPVEYVFRYENGRYTRLRTPAGNWHVYPSPAINEAGDIVINAEPSGNSGGEGSIVLLWPAGSTAAQKLPLPPGANAYAVTDDGTIVGAMYRDGAAVAAYAWDQRGKGRKLMVPAGAKAAAYAARGGWATGGLWPSQTAARWDLRTGRVDELKTAGPGDAVNAAGWVVAHGSLVSADGPVGLDVPSGQRAVAVAVSDTGLVVGQARSDDDAGWRNLGPRAWRC
ncbi:hypothetical protein [Micromonospora sp. HK10]|uniref:hypothetical protein n=1 Tax=Micromonospora sp. HK10 TaxID=1538294 RepID=UPI0006271CA5|nr:hypothetical protein [Micromonospora sp. HK10]KKK05534.1 hypothetical protein LQ51_13265 [Micromonospora sp. HK10]